jgi:hypothetical protein
METNMKDILLDVISHVSAFKNVEFLKITSTEDETKIESLSDDRSLIMRAITKTPVIGLNGIFGISNFDRLYSHLKNPEFSNSDNIKVVYQEKDGEDVPISLFFKNQAGDYETSFPFMNQSFINEKVKTPKPKLNFTWNCEFEPSDVAIKRFKGMKSTHQAEEFFKSTMTTTGKNSDLVFSFGQKGGHFGSFVFHTAPNKLERSLLWPSENFSNAMNLHGDKYIKISDMGLMEITVDSGLVFYTFTMTAKA